MYSIIERSVSIVIETDFMVIMFLFSGSDSKCRFTLLSPISLIFSVLWMFCNLLEMETWSIWSLYMLRLLICFSPFIGLKVIGWLQQSMEQMVINLYGKLFMDSILTVKMKWLTKLAVSIQNHVSFDSLQWAFSVTVQYTSILNIVVCQPLLCHQVWSNFRYGDGKVESNLVWDSNYFQLSSARKLNWFSQMAWTILNRIIAVETQLVVYLWSYSLVLLSIRILFFLDSRQLHWGFGAVPFCNANPFKVKNKTICSTIHGQYNGYCERCPFDLSEEFDMSIVSKPFPMNNSCLDSLV